MDSSGCASLSSESTQRPGLRLLPRLDLELFKALGTYDKIDPEIGDVALSKLSNHLWYMSRELVGLSFLDSDVSCETENAMVTALRRE